MTAHAYEIYSKIMHYDTQIEMKQGDPQFFLCITFQYTNIAKIFKKILIIPIFFKLQNADFLIKKLFLNYAVFFLFFV